MRGKVLVIQILIACVGSATPLWAQSEAVIRGQLIADADGSVLPQGTVTLTAIATGTATAAMVDSVGGFTFPNVSPGEYRLTGSAEGFSNRDLRLVLEPREVRAVTLRLALSRGCGERERHRRTRAASEHPLSELHRPAGRSPRASPRLAAHRPSRCHRDGGAGHDSATTISCMCAAKRWRSIR